MPLFAVPDDVRPFPFPAPPDFSVRLGYERVCEALADPCWLAGLQQLTGAQGLGAEADPQLSAPRRYVSLWWQMASDELAWDDGRRSGAGQLDHWVYLDWKRAHPGDLRLVCRAPRRSRQHRLDRDAPLDPGSSDRAAVGRAEAAGRSHCPYPEPGGRRRSMNLAAQLPLLPGSDHRLHWRGQRTRWRDVTR